MYAYELGIFEQQCHALAEAVRARGATLRKRTEHEIVIDVRGHCVAFPVASDERDWLLTTPEEAFHAAMLDAEALDTVSEAVVPRAGEGNGLVLALADLLGGKAAFLQVLRAGGFLPEAESRFRR